MVRRSASTGKTAGGRQRIVPRGRATLPQTDQELQAVLDTIDYGILFMGPDLRAKLINRAFRKMWDISDEFIRKTRPMMRDLVTHVWGKNLYDAPADQFEQYVEKRVEAVRKGTASITEMRLRDGRVIQFQTRPLPDGGRMLTYFDITALKRSEENATRARDIAEMALADLSARDQELHAVLDTIDYGILFMGPDLRAKLINRAFRKMWDISAEFIRETRPTMRDLVTTTGAGIGPIRCGGRPFARSCRRVNLSGSGPFIPQQQTCGDCIGMPVLCQTRKSLVVRPSSRERVEQRLGLLQIERVEAFGEPAIDRREKIVGLLPLAVIAPKPRQARRRAQLPGLCLLRPRNRERALEIGLRFRCIRLRGLQCNFAAHAMNFGFAPFFLGCFNRRSRFADAAPSVIELAEFRISSR
jgi:PAS domain-containing protein